MRDEFKVHKLNAEGLQKAGNLGTEFSTLLNRLETEYGIVASREASLVVTNLQLAAFWAKRAIAVREENQEK